MVSRVKVAVKSKIKANARAIAKARVARSEGRFELVPKRPKKKPQTPAQKKDAQARNSRRYRKTSVKSAIRSKKRGLLIGAMIVTPEEDSLAERHVKLQAEAAALR